MLSNREFVFKERKSRIMFLFQAAEGIGKADGHYSGWNPARPYDIIFICQEKHLHDVSQTEEGEARPNQSCFLRMAEDMQTETSDNSTCFIYKGRLAGWTPRVCQALRTGEQTA